MNFQRYLYIMVLEAFVLFREIKSLTPIKL